MRGRIHKKRPHLPPATLSSNHQNPINASTHQTSIISTYPPIHPSMLRTEDVDRSTARYRESLQYDLTPYVALTNQSRYHAPRVIGKIVRREERSNIYSSKHIAPTLTKTHAFPHYGDPTSMRAMGARFGVSRGNHGTTERGRQKFTFLKFPILPQTSTGTVFKTR